MRALGALIAVTSATLAACGTDPSIFHVGCSQIDAVEISAGLSPTFTWSPACAVATVAVYEKFVSEDPLPVPVPGALIWKITTDPASGGNLVEPGVQYGVAPTHSVELTAAAPLVPGRGYLLFLGVQRAQSPMPEGGYTAFTP